MRVPDPSAARASSTGVRASETALPGPAGAIPKPSITIRTSGPRGVALTGASRRAHDGGEGVGVEARAAHQRAVDVRLGHQVAGAVSGVTLPP